MQPPQQYRARLEDKIVHNEKFTEFSFELIEPNKLEFTAGQYVSIKVTEQGERRSYSMCSSPEFTNEFKTVVDLSPGGKGSQFLQNLNFGDEVEVLAPMGRFIVNQELPSDHLVFVATGSGISPFKSMIEDQLRHKQDKRQITLHWGVRHAEDLFWLQEWQELDEAFPNFHFHPVLSKAPEEWTLCRGRVTDCLSVHGLPENATYYLCGSGAMIDDTTRLLLENGVPKEQIINEEFFQDLRKQETQATQEQQEAAAQ